jgi:hypothetical protein
MEQSDFSGISNQSNSSDLGVLPDEDDVITPLTIDMKITRTDSFK